MYKCQISGRIEKDAEANAVCFKKSCITSLEVLRKTTKTLNNNKWPPDRESNPVPSTYETGAATTQFYDACLRHITFHLCPVPPRILHDPIMNDSEVCLSTDSNAIEGILLWEPSSFARQFTEHCYTMLKIRSMWRMVYQNMPQTNLITTENPYNSTFANDVTMFDVP